MSLDTSIAWTDHTLNFWQGCHKVSPGCARCYMERDKKRYGQNPDVVVRSSDATFYAPLRQKAWRDPAKVFVCSWSDFFIEEADPWRAAAWDVMRRTPHLTYQILTKRPGRIGACLPNDWGRGYPNVWLGVTAEDQPRADERITHLLATPAAVRFVSVEPMIGPVDLLSVDGGVARGMLRLNDEEPGFPSDRLDWVIVGAESGPNARPCSLMWVRDLVRQCREAGVPAFVKQLRLSDEDDRLSRDPSEWEEDLRVREWPRAQEGSR